MKNVAELLKEDCHQVFLMASRAHLPFFFAIHPWIVINNHGKLSRWEIIYRKDFSGTHWGHLYRDFYPPFQGLPLTPHSRKTWTARSLGSVDGEEAEKMIAIIEESSQTYPYLHTYSLTGPNSNTYVQWVLKKLPYTDLSLPWNAFGKRLFLLQ